MKCKNKISYLRFYKLFYLINICYITIFNVNGLQKCCLNFALNFLICLIILSFELLKLSFHGIKTLVMIFDGF